MVVEDARVVVVTDVTGIAATIVEDRSMSGFVN